MANVQFPSSAPIGSHNELPQKPPVQEEHIKLGESALRQLDALTNDIQSVGYQKKEIDATLDPQKHIVTVTVKWELPVGGKGGPNVESINKIFEYVADESGEVQIGETLHEKKPQQAQGELKAGPPSMVSIMNKIEAGRENFGYKVIDQTTQGTRVDTQWEEKGNIKRQAYLITPEGVATRIVPKSVEAVIGQGNAQVEPNKLKYKKVEHLPLPVIPNVKLGAIDKLLNFIGIKTSNYAAFEITQIAKAGAKAVTEREAAEERSQNLAKAKDGFEPLFEKFFKDPGSIPVGIFRIAADETQKNGLLDKLKTAENPEQIQQEISQADPNLAAETLKKLVRDNFKMPQRGLNKLMQFLSAENSPDPIEKGKQVRDVFTKNAPTAFKANQFTRFLNSNAGLSSQEKELMGTLLQNLKKLSESSETHKMDAHNLAVVWGAALIPATEAQFHDPTQIGTYSQKVVEAFTDLIAHYEPGSLGEPIL